MGSTNLLELFLHHPISFYQCLSAEAMAQVVTSEAHIPVASLPDLSLIMVQQIAGQHCAQVAEEEVPRPPTDWESEYYYYTIGGES